MGFDDYSAPDMRDFTDSLPVRAWRFAATELHPWQGWIVLTATVALAVLPAYVLLANHWIRLPETASILATTGALAVLTTWWIAGWRRPATAAHMRVFARIYAAIALLLIGALMVSILITRWLPDGTLLGQALRTGDAGAVVTHMNEAFERFGARFSVWLMGAQGGSVIPDERVFALFAAALIWPVAALSAALVRQTRRALPACAPLLIIIGAIVFFGGIGRLYFLSALAVTLCLHVALDNNALAERWQRVNADYNPELLRERWLNAAALASLALLLAAVAPVFSVRSIAEFYSRLVAPLDQRIETVRQQAFPNIETTPRYQIAGATTGLPNSFLLGSGPELNRTRILELRTGDPAISYDAPPFAPYLNATAFTHYTGLGWEPEAEHTLLRLPADTRRDSLSVSDRRLLAQTVRTYLPADTLFAAGEFAEAGADAWLKLDAQNQLLSITTGARSYSIVSFTPALDEDALRAIGPWDETQPLPAGFDAYLALPPTVTPRTRVLAEELTAGLAAPYAKALAIQDYLRTFAYSLEIDAPPADVVDVADYFLFTLQKGYCDYYATAFVVMARMVGLPTRFVTGYAPGNWFPDARAWIVTAADSHAWPEVYLAGVGWIAFEPTAARAQISRIGKSTPSLATPAPPVPAPPAPARIAWNPQMLFWLLPLGLLLWAVWRTVRRIQVAREDPWLALQAWGERAGRPPQAGETAREYGAALAANAEALGTRNHAEAQRLALGARALGEAVSTAHYAPAAQRAEAGAEAQRVWHTLRPLLAGLRRPKAPPR